MNCNTYISKVSLLKIRIYPFKKKNALFLYDAQNLKITYK